MDVFTPGHSKQLLALMFSNDHGWMRLLNIFNEKLMRFDKLIKTGTVGKLIYKDLTIVITSNEQ